METIARSGGATSVFLAYSVALIGGGSALIAGIPLHWYSDSFMPGLGGGMLIVAGASVFFGKVVRGSGKAACPGCGGALGDLQISGRNDGVLCTSCGAFVEGEAGMLRLTAADRVADAPLFGAVLPESFAWPDGCVVCGGPATRHEAIQTTVTNLGASAAKSIAASALGAIAGVGVLVRTGSTVTVQVPHCDHHQSGARLEPGAANPANIVFRSHAYQRSFCQKNQVSPAEAISHLRVQTSAGRMLGQALPR